MRFFRKRLMVLFLAALLAVFLVFSNPTPRESQAAYSTAILLAAIKFATKIITDQIFEAFSGMIKAMAKKIFDFFIPFMKKIWEEYATEQRLSEIEQVSQIGEFMNASAQQNYIDQVEEQRLKDLKEARVSTGECRIVTASALSSMASVSTRQYEAYLREEVRKDQGFTQGSLYDKGPVVANKRLREERFSKYCDKTEHLGNLSEICANNNQQNIDKDKATHMLMGCNTIKKADEEAVLQMIRYLNPPPGSTPLPKSIRTDTAVQDAYLARTIARAKKEPYEAVLLKQIARHMEPTTCGKVPNTNVDGLTFVNAIDRRLGKPIPVGRPCPSEAELECYVHNFQFQDPAFVQDCNEGEAQLERCTLAINAMRTQLSYESTLLRDKQLLMGIVDQPYSSVSPPADSIGRGN